MITIPKISVKYRKFFPIFAIIRLDFEINAPIITNGIPIPIEYASSKLNAMDGDVAASVIMVPSIGPTHGVHPAANAIPNKNDTGYLAPAFFGKIFFSVFNTLILLLRIMYAPNPIMIKPPIWLNSDII